MTKKILPRKSKEELMKIHDFDYIRENFFKLDYTYDDLFKDIQVCRYTQLSQDRLSAEGPNTQRVTNYFCNVTQSKATSIRSKMSPYNAIYDDDALCEILNKIDNHPKFFSIRKDTEQLLQKEGVYKYLSMDLDQITNPEQKSEIERLQNYCKEQLNKADVREVRRAMSHIPAYHKVSQFPNHVAQRVYERYAPKYNGVVLDSSCVDENTEFFNGRDWIKVKYYSENDYVLQADISRYEIDGTISLDLVKPLNFINFGNVAPFYDIRTPENHHMWLTINHNVVYKYDGKLHRETLFQPLISNLPIQIPYLTELPDPEKWDNVKVKFTKEFNIRTNTEIHDEFRETEKYCFTVPSHNLVLRRNGFIFITGNCGWGNRLMAAMTSNYDYKYLGTDPNSEMHPNYYGLAEIMYKALYTNQARKFPDDFIDIRDQGSEFDIPEWHNWSGYTEEQKQEILSRTVITPGGGKVYKSNGIEHPINGKGCCDTGNDNTTGLQLPPIYDTHNPDVYYSGVGDVSFTSPPYFALECYTEDSFKGNRSSGQSASKGDNYSRWVKEFVYPTVVNHFNYLKPGAIYAYNLKDLPNDHMYLYADWLSICLDVGFELLEQPEMFLKAKRQFGINRDGTSKINFNGSTERIAVLRKPLHPDDPSITMSNKGALYHIQNNFNYPLIKLCRPKEFQSMLPSAVVSYLENKYANKTYKYKPKNS